MIASKTTKEEELLKNSPYSCSIFRQLQVTGTLKNLQAGLFGQLEANIHSLLKVNIGTLCKVLNTNIKAADMTGLEWDADSLV
jgi:hypothetical protein